MKKRRSIVILVLTIIVAVPFLMLMVLIGIALYKNPTILKPLKTAVKESELVGKNYILGEHVSVTGFDWYLIKDENGEEGKEYFNVIGPNPFEEFSLSYDFYVSGNIYIFYITKKRRYYSEKMREDMLEYIVTGWDILYPVRRVCPDNIPFINKYITEYDLWKDD
jgi:hypothetical protein